MKPAQVATPERRIERLRIVVEVPNRVIMPYRLAKPPADMRAKIATLIRTLKDPTVLPKTAEARVVVDGSAVTVTTLAAFQRDAATHLRAVTDAMTVAFGAGTFTGPKQAASVYTPTDKREIDAVATILTRRLNDMGTSRVTTSTDGANRLLLDGLVASRARARSIIGTTGQLEFRLIPQDVTVSVDDATGVVSITNTHTMKTEDAEAVIACAEFIAPGSAFDGKCEAIQTNGKWAVTFQIRTSTSSGVDYRAQFAQVTREHSGARTGAGSQIAIVLDGAIISAPYIQSEIQGAGIITGPKDEQEARRLATLLNAGALPVPIRIGEER